MKHLTIMGHLGGDATLHTGNGTTTLRFSVAVTESWKNAQGEKVQQTDWFSVFSKQTSLQQYLKKGTPVLVMGPLKATIDRSQATNQQYINFTMNAEKIQLLPGGTKPTAEAATTPPVPQSSTTAPAGNDDDLPF